MDPNTPGGFGGQPPPQQGWPQQQQQQQQYQQPPAPAMGDTPFASAKAAGYVPTDEEKQQAFYAHLFGALGTLVLCGTGLHLVGPLVPMFMAKQRTPFLMYHVNQAFWFQVGLFALNAILAIIFTVLAMVTCGIGSFLFILNGIPVLIAIGYPFLVGMKAKELEPIEEASHV